MSWWMMAVPAGAVLMSLPYLRQRLALSRAKHRSLAGHSRMAKRLARWMPGYSLGDEWLACDGAPANVVARRQQAFEALVEGYANRYVRGLAWTTQARETLADMPFTSRYRVPFPFADAVTAQLKVPAVVAKGDGMTLTDLDGNELLDLTGSYGVNVMGNEVYKECMRQGLDDTLPLGLVLGQYHPVVLDNLEALKRISGKEAVSFHMSGTEAVMQAVRLARYHTGRRHVVRFCGAYHGWWEDVQPGPGNPMPPRETYTLSDMSEKSLRVLAQRKDIACVLVNPLQALHPNRNAPSDSTLLTGERKAGFDRAAYTEWLQRLREVCTRAGIVLIFDEVFLGFRLAKGGAQAYFGVQADMVTYGKTLAGGFPVGVVCGPMRLMKRYREERPADVCFARGTFNAHPAVMGAMNAFLQRLQAPSTDEWYAVQDRVWTQRLLRFNQAMQEAGLPVRAEGMHSVWTLTYVVPGRFHWMYQFYLRWHGLALSWVGTGRWIFGLDCSDADFDEVVRRAVAAGRAMEEGGWWDKAWQPDARSVRRGLRTEWWQALTRRRVAGSVLAQ